ncbi:transmembrane protein 50A [Anthonomus grandis grandis]|uniref:transmembrane protein 50A n=1 Tax=Anthonomus grandis grandis TaxID=2921223 RepID=UPI0021666A44|nr:transmembrane protein 50A [Anthonomus grandis grandis]
MAIFDCLRNVNMPGCIWFEGDKKNAYASMLAGFLFFTGWWIIIDSATKDPGLIPAGYWMCGVAGTISLIMVNSVSNAQMGGDSFEGGCLGTRGARIWIFLGFVFGFASVIASCMILFLKYMHEEKKAPGVALFLHNAFICMSMIIFKFGRTEDVWG